MADVKTLFAVILACLFAFEVNTLRLFFKGPIAKTCVNGGKYLKKIKCNHGTSYCEATTSGRSCRGSTDFTIEGGPATGRKKCIQFTEGSVNYALKVLGTNPPTLKFMRQRLCDQAPTVDNAYLFEEQQIINSTNNWAYIYTHNNTRMCLSRVCKGKTLTLKTIKAGSKELDRMCAFKHVRQC